MGLPIKYNTVENYDLDDVSFDEETLEKIDEYISSYVQEGEHYYLEDDDVVNYIDSEMAYDDYFNFTRVDTVDDDFNMEVGDSIDFRNYFTSFSSSMDATNEIIPEFHYEYDENVVIYRTHGVVGHFNMLDYNDGYEYQLEHLLHGDGWKITGITDISEEYPSNKIVFLVDIVNVNES